LRDVTGAPASEHAVADYLQTNPDFFERHGALLTSLRLPDNRGAAAVSLIERQVLALRDKNHGLETRLRELIEVARNNDLLATKIHRLACGLIRARTAALLLETLETSLREDFGAAEWVVLLSPPEHSELRAAASRHLRVIGADAPEWRMFDNVFVSGKPRCGQIRDSQRDFLFGAGNIEIGSAALAPLGSSHGSGILAIGNPDAEHFHPAMGTEFLARISELVGEAVRQV
jgi:uncharacterized protein YigA (DUF484 family)